jgi:hypothetical protein
MKAHVYAFLAVLAGTGLAAADEFSADNGFGDHSPPPQVLSGRMSGLAPVGIDRTPTAATSLTSDIYLQEFSADNGFGDHSPAPQVLTKRDVIDYRTTGSIGERAERRPQSGYAIPVWLPFM